MQLGPSVGFSTVCRLHFAAEMLPKNTGHSTDTNAPRVSSPGKQSAEKNMHSHAGTVSPSTSTSAPATVGIWGQCGGRNYSGPTKCLPDLLCNVVNEWYSNCVPDPKAVGVAVWQQCGGQGYTGPTKCVLFTTCVVLNPWYSQCQP
jgi:Fungal cellulose binding domain